MILIEKPNVAETVSCNLTTLDDNIPEDYICKICQKPGHFIRNCPQKKKSQETPPEGYTCKICNVNGHWIQNCPEKNKASRGMLLYYHLLV